MTLPKVTRTVPAEPWWSLANTHACRCPICGGAAAVLKADLGHRASRRDDYYATLRIGCSQCHRGDSGDDGGHTVQFSGMTADELNERLVQLLGET